MFKLLILNLLVIISLSKASIIKDAVILDSTYLQSEPPLPIAIEDREELWEKWGHHVMDFLKLVDMGKMMPIVLQYLEHPEFAELNQFLYSADFKKLVHDFESLKEFNEAINYIESKGYDAQEVLDTINSEIESINTNNDMNNKKFHFGNEMTNFIEQVVEVLPLDKIKELFKKKLQTDAEIATLFECLTSDEFKDIIKRMLANSKFIQIKKSLKGYGFDFQRLRALAENVVGDFFDGMF